MDKVKIIEALVYCDHGYLGDINIDLDEGVVTYLVDDTNNARTTNHTIAEDIRKEFNLNVSIEYLTPNGNGTSEYKLTILN